MKDGLLVSCSTGLARKLRAEPPAAVLTSLGKQFQFEARSHTCASSGGPPNSQS